MRGSQPLLVKVWNADRQDWYICDRSCHQHIRDDGNRYKEEEFDCIGLLVLWKLISSVKTLVFTVWSVSLRGKL